MFGTKILIRNVILCSGGNGVVGHTEWDEAPWACVPGPRHRQPFCFHRVRKPCLAQRDASQRLFMLQGVPCVLPLIPALNCPLKRKKAIGCSSPVSSSCSQETMGVERMALPRSGLRRWLIYQDQTGAQPPEPLLFGVVAASSRCLSPPQLPTVFELLLPQLKHSCQHVPLCPRPFTSKGAWGSTRLCLSGRGLPGPSTRWSHSPPDNSRGSFFCICLSAHSK